MPDPLDTFVLAAKKRLFPEPGAEFDYEVMFCDSLDGLWKGSDDAYQVSGDHRRDPPDFYKYIDPPPKELQEGLRE